MSSVFEYDCDVCHQVFDEDEDSYHEEGFLCDNCEEKGLLYLYNVCNRCNRKLKPVSTVRFLNDYNEEDDIHLKRVDGQREQNNKIELENRDSTLMYFNLTRVERKFYPDCSMFFWYCKNCTVKQTTSTD